MQDNAININKTEQTSECKQIQLPIGGMSCAVCAKRVEKAISELEGVADVNVNFAAEKAFVTYNPFSLLKALK